MLPLLLLELLLEELEELRVTPEDEEADELELEEDEVEDELDDELLEEPP